MEHNEELNQRYYEHCLEIMNAPYGGSKNTYKEVFAEKIGKRVFTLKDCLKCLNTRDCSKRVVLDYNKLFHDRIGNGEYWTHSKTMFHIYSSFLSVFKLKPIASFKADEDYFEPELKFNGADMTKFAVEDLSKPRYSKAVMYRSGYATIINKRYLVKFNVEYYPSSFEGRIMDVGGIDRTDMYNDFDKSIITDLANVSEGRYVSLPDYKDIEKSYKFTKMKTVKDKQNAFKDKARIRLDDGLLVNADLYIRLMKALKKLDVRAFTLERKLHIVSGDSFHAVFSGVLEDSDAIIIN